MYNPAAFVENRTEILHEFIRLHPFATLISSDANGIEATHAPMFLDESKRVLQCHVARANPHWQRIAGAPEVLVIFHGPHHYISPSWYASKQQSGRVVPTWNYTAVHVRGRARIFGDTESLVTVVRKLTDQHEAAFPDPWSIDDAPADYIGAAAKAIVGIEIPIESMEGKAKLSQNRADLDRRSMIEGLEGLGTPESVQMAALMRKALTA